MKIFVIFLSLCVSATAQRTVSLIWADSTNPAGTVYDLYRASGVCNPAPTFAKIAPSLAAKNYLDAGLQPGTYCYVVAAVVNGVASPMSAPPVQVSVQPAAPTGLTATIVALIPRPVIVGTMTSQGCGMGTGFHLAGPPVSVDPKTGKALGGQGPVSNEGIGGCLK